MNRGDKTLLLVDDLAEILSLLEEELSNEGYKLYTANGGNEAIRILETQHIDLMITDIRMPDMLGFQLLEIVRPLYPDLKCVYMTGYSEYDNTSDRTPVFMKPFDLAELVEFLDKQFAT